MSSIERFGVYEGFGNLKKFQENHSSVMRAITHTRSIPSCPLANFVSRFQG
jgi:hypothetical protein